MKRMSLVRILFSLPWCGHVKKKNFPNKKIKDIKKKSCLFELRVFD
jgi:hypothetical protein